MKPVHDLAVCRSVLQQVLQVTASAGGGRVGRIRLRIGPLAGVEPSLLCSAFPLVAAGTPCDRAMIAIEGAPVRVRCDSCALTSDVRPNRLLCARCGAWRVKLVSGDEMLLVGIELLDAPAIEAREPADV
jgi:hydrogenase nickel incorporation protein HypA/HybF